MDTTHDASTAMPVSHRVLFNVDLLHLIFSHLRRPPSPPDHPEEDRLVGVEEATLARAARVCKTFSDPALAVLWSSIPTMRHLWFTLEPLRVIRAPITEPTEPLRESSLRFVRSSPRPILELHLIDPHWLDSGSDR